MSGSSDWIAWANYTDRKLRDRQGGAIPVRAKKLILAAGTFGSTEILLRSRSPSCRLSRCLGRGFSTNGDMIAAIHGGPAAVNVMADEDLAAAHRGIGPTITGVAQIEATASRPGIVIEDLAIPAPLGRLFQEIITTSKFLHELQEADAQPHERGVPSHDPLSVDAEAIERTSVYALIGDDNAEGRLELSPRAETHEAGVLSVVWPELRTTELFKVQMRVLSALQKGADRQGR